MHYANWISYLCSIKHVDELIHRLHNSGLGACIYIGRILAGCVSYTAGIDISLLL